MEPDSTEGNDPMISRRTKRGLAAALAVAATVTPISALAQGQPPIEAFASDAAPEGAVWADTLDVSQTAQDWGRPQSGKSVGERPLMLKGQTYLRGIGTHASSTFTIDLKGSALRFAAIVGVDDEVGANGSVVFEVWVDGKRTVRTGTLRGGGEPQAVSVNIAGAKRLSLVVTDADDGIGYDHANWAGAMLFLKPGAKTTPVALTVPVEVPVIASSVSARPSINGPQIVGASPGHDFLFLIPATGEPPLTFAADGLPDGLSLDPATGIISGSLKEACKTRVRLTVRGPKGIARRDLTIVAEKGALAQTPPMGWNSWNVWGCAVDAEKVRAAADWMVKSGLAAHGYQYINIDDCWEGTRDKNGEITTNDKFGDMRALADYVHSKGLKLGIYSSPGPKTCAGFEGSYRHEEQDARTFARWGIDYLKYDWCSYGGVAKNNSLEELQKPYYLMRSALDKCGRDIVFSLCQYGMGKVWEWGARVGGHCWRTTGDITDTWSSLESIGFSQDGHEKFAGPGHWNDPDMLIVGNLGWGPNLHPTRLTPMEQLTHITLWCLLSSPLLLGCDLSALDKFTVDLLTNDEALAVNQDPLGKPAGRKKQVGKLEVWARPLADGTTAVGLFNREMEKARVSVTWAELGLEGEQPVRDLWRKRNLGVFQREFSAAVPAHGALLLKVGRPRS